MRVERLMENEGGAIWDAWVAPRTHTVTDLFAWSAVVREAYGMKAYLMIARNEEGQIRGALSLYEVRHSLLGHYLTTAPFGNDGGLLYDDLRARDVLLAEAKRLCAERRTTHVVIRTSGEDLPSFQPDHRYHTAVVDLSDGAEGLWHRLPATTRNQIRRGRKEGFVVHSGPADVESFQEAGMAAAGGNGCWRSPKRSLPSASPGPWRGPSGTAASPRRRMPSSPSPPRPAASRC